MLFQETIIAQTIKIIIYITILFLLIYSLTLKLYYKSNSCKLSYIWDKFNYKSIINEVIKIKNKLN